MHQGIDLQASVSGAFSATSALARVVRLSSRHAWPVILGFLLAAIVCGNYFVRHFVITSDSNKLMSSALPGLASLGTAWALPSGPASPWDGRRPCWG